MSDFAEYREWRLAQLDEKRQNEAQAVPRNAHVEEYKEHLRRERDRKLRKSHSDWSTFFTPGW